MTEINNILYCSGLCSSKKLSEISNNSKKTPLYSIQKFHRLITSGLVLNNIKVLSLSVLPVTFKYYDKINIKPIMDNENSLYFKYIPFINLPFLKQLCIFFYSFYFTLSWSLKNNRKQSAVICDILTYSVSFGALLASKIRGIKCCAIVTDLPKMIGQAKSNNQRSFIANSILTISSLFTHKFNCYVFLTKFMNPVINTQQKRHIIMEGLVDIKMSRTFNSPSSNENEKIILYSGSLYEKYGVRMLIEAFMLLTQRNFRLHLYGFGEMEKDIIELAKKDERIFFFGVVSNNVIVKKQMEATLLVNPRFSNNEFTRYSFPSKNMEYMVSGTPVLTTSLAGMPEEYYNYVYIIKDESVEGMRYALQTILTKDQEELRNFGQTSKQFVLRFKNNKIQARRIINLIAES